MSQRMNDEGLNTSVNFMREDPNGGMTEYQNRDYEDNTIQYHNKAVTVPSSGLKYMPYLKQKHRYIFNKENKISKVLDDFSHFYENSPIDKQIMKLSERKTRAKPNTADWNHSYGVQRRASHNPQLASATRPIASDRNVTTTISKIQNSGGDTRQIRDGIINRFTSERHHQNIQLKQISMNESNWMGDENVFNSIGSPNQEARENSIFNLTESPDLRPSPVVKTGNNVVIGIPQLPTHQTTTMNELDLKSGEVKSGHRYTRDSTASGMKMKTNQSCVVSDIRYLSPEKVEAEMRQNKMKEAQEEKNKRFKIHQYIWIHNPHLRRYDRFYKRVEKTKIIPDVPMRKISLPAKSTKNMKLPQFTTKLDTEILKQKYSILKQIDLENDNNYQDELQNISADQIDNSNAKAKIVSNLEMFSLPNNESYSNITFGRQYVLPSLTYKQFGNQKIITPVEKDIILKFALNKWPDLFKEEIKCKIGFHASLNKYNIIFYGDHCPLSKCCESLLLIELSSNREGKVLCLQKSCINKTVEIFILDEFTHKNLFVQPIQNPEFSQNESIYHKTLGGDFKSPPRSAKVSKRLSNNVKTGAHKYVSLYTEMEAESEKMPLKKVSRTLPNTAGEHKRPLLLYSTQKNRVQASYYEQYELSSLLMSHKSSQKSINKAKYPSADVSFSRSARKKLKFRHTDKEINESQQAVLSTLPNSDLSNSIILASDVDTDLNIIFEKLKIPAFRTKEFPLARQTFNIKNQKVQE